MHQFGYNKCLLNVSSGHGKQPKLHSTGIWIQRYGDRAFLESSNRGYDKYIYMSYLFIFKIQQDCQYTIVTAHSQSEQHKRWDWLGPLLGTPSPAPMPFSVKCQAARHTCPRQKKKIATCCLLEPGGGCQCGGRRLLPTWRQQAAWEGDPHGMEGIPAEATHGGDPVGSLWV